MTPFMLRDTDRHFMKIQKFADNEQPMNHLVAGDITVIIKLRPVEKNNSTRLRRILVRLQGTSSGAYLDMCRRM
jgi:hypothetical protein